MQAAFAGQHHFLALPWYKTSLHGGFRFWKLFGKRVLVEREAQRGTFYYGSHNIFPQIGEHYYANPVVEEFRKKFPDLENGMFGKQFLVSAANELYIEDSIYDKYTLLNYLKRVLATDPTLYGRVHNTWTHTRFILDAVLNTESDEDRAKYKNLVFRLEEMDDLQANRRGYGEDEDERSVMGAESIKDYERKLFRAQEALLEIASEYKSKMAAAANESSQKEVILPDYVILPILLYCERLELIRKVGHAAHGLSMSDLPLHIKTYLG